MIVEAPFSSGVAPVRKFSTHAMRGARLAGAALSLSLMLPHDTAPTTDTQDFSQNHQEIFQGVEPSSSTVLPDGKTVILPQIFSCPAEHCAQAPQQDADAVQPVSETEGPLNYPKVFSCPIDKCAPWYPDSSSSQ